MKKGKAPYLYAINGVMYQSKLPTLKVMNTSFGYIYDTISVTYYV